MCDTEHYAANRLESYINRWPPSGHPAVPSDWLAAWSPSFCPFAGLILFSPPALRSPPCLSFKLLGEASNSPYRVSHDFYLFYFVAHFCLSSSNPKQLFALKSSFIVEMSNVT